MKKYATFFLALKRHPHLTKEQAVLNFTNGQTNSLKALDHWEVQELTRRLNDLAPAPSPKGEGRAYPGGEKAIIAIWRSMGRQPADAIAWAEKQGVKGVKKRFNDYTNGELYILIAIAEKAKNDWLAQVRK